ncbi:MAG: M20 family metallopeptidase [Candidatus Woesearchaeota archaeon]
MELTELTKKLIGYKTTADQPEELKRCIDFVERYFEGCNVFVKRYEKNQKHSIVVTLKKTKRPELFLIAHADVVPADDADFSPKVKGRRLYGRGALDDKSSVAIIMGMIKQYSKQQKKPDIGVMITTDEEIGSKNGVEYLVNKVGYRCKFCIVLDGGHKYEIVTKEKGALGVKLSVQGKEAHGSMPWKGENSIEKLLEEYIRLKKRFPKTTKTDRWKPTINLGMIKGGRVLNQVPGFAEMWLDIRYTDDKFKKMILGYMKKIRGVKCEILGDALILTTNENNEYVVALEATMKSSLGAAKISREHGATDARFFGAKGIPAVLILPSGSNVHASNEYVEIASQEEVYWMLKDFIDNNARVIK